ncbi:DsbA family protein [Streptomyces sp. SCSIO 30461]|uniref:DsbA family protein n=1 Tax=Streptomyces sp. SCSIO 30461 TaxID=3118085 RepID=UPI0030D385F9
MPDSLKPFVLGAGVAAIAVVLGVVSYTATTRSEPAASSGDVAAESTAPESGVYPELEKLARRAPGDPMAIGRADAPVVMIEYADFKCGYCAKFARDTQPALVKRYVDEGILRIEWRNFPVFGDESQTAARASWAAGRQGRFWQFHDAVYATGGSEKGFGTERLRELARQAGVEDLGRFAGDADSRTARQAVARDEEEAYALGATSTPSFLVNGRPIAGAQSEATFVELIETARESADPGMAAGPDGPGPAATSPFAARSASPGPTTTPGAARQDSAR